MISSICIIFGIAEIVMRISWQMGGWVQRAIYQRSSDPYLRYELVPGAKAGNVSVNKDGFRGRDYAIPKPSNTFRILMLGDSEILSWLLQDKDTLPVQFENLLNQKSSNLHYEVLNFGVEGYCTFQELEQLKVKGLKYDPDLIILNYCLNDPEPGEYYFNKSFLMRHSALWRYFNFRIKKTLIKRERRKLNIHTEKDHFFYYYQPKYFQPLTNAILEMSDISKQRGKKLIVLIFPTSSLSVTDFKENYPYSKLHTLLKSIPSDNIIFIDLIDEFNRLGMTPQSVSISYKDNESHKNPAALKVTADCLYQVLKTNKLIPE